MTERTGATWLRQQLNSHPNIVSLNEYYHQWQRTRREALGDSATSVQGLTDVLTGKDYIMRTNMLQKRVETKGAPVLAIGMKLKFLYCAFKPETSSEWCFSHPDYPAFKNSHIICSLRANALELAWSKMSQLVVSERCKFSNVENAKHRACFDGTNWTINPEDLYKLTVERMIQTEKIKSVCEAQAKRGPTHFAWYEKFLMNPVEEMTKVVSFLGVPPFPTPPTSNSRKANNVFLDARIPNWKDVARRFAGTSAAWHIEDAQSISPEAKEEFNLMNQEALSRPMV